MKKIFAIFLILLFLSVCAVSQTTARGARILLVPLDDRPPCLQFPVRMGSIADAEVVAPPTELLGRFTEPGKSDRIIEWFKTQDLSSFDAAVVSIDMLAYGGLVAMRVHQTDERTAKSRLDFVREMKKRAPKMKIYASSTIMRLAPTGTGENEAYRENLSKWAEISADPDLKEETLRLEAKIPPSALADYKAARVRDLRINRKAIELVGQKVFDYLILSQDDAKPKGVHVADRELLIAEIKRLKLNEKIAVQPGADEVGMLLLARALTDEYDFHPKIRAIYSSEATRDRVMPFEDRPLRQTVSFQIKAAGAIEVSPATAALPTDLDFFVFASRHETGAARKFAAEVFEGKNAIVADVDPKGDVQGADLKFTEFLIDPESSGKGARTIPANYGNLLLLDGYASWNTAGNTIGTALPQGILSRLADDLYSGGSGKKPRNARKTLFRNNAGFLNRAVEAQYWFTLHRLIDDYAFHSIVRPKALKMIRENKWNALRLTGEQTREVEEFCLRELEPVVARIAADFRVFTKGDCEMSPISFDLPWNRTFEATIDFKLHCRAVSEKKR